ncbi:proteasome maturation factor UMP1-domain-containing protein [Tricharina praecox]|uniref:proteasome maturation factor UMP1-domain-containing protein n=1 Tax=Tricharina praecox TaxID=43433 RepID=UPI002220FA6A|nr:proteasome maturation factor UMP1-domain-containing protein [Tricharina praecox]KAI5846898.1 proteasome maturation factor UMP1-domain-containing protein [Tricharina praecox]
MSLRIIPAAPHASKVSTIADGTAAPSAPSVRDSLRTQGPHRIAADLNNRHPLEARLKNWDATQMSLKMEGLRRLYGAAEPIRRGMEISFCNDYKPAQLGGPSNLHRDILENRDCDITWEDIYSGQCYGEMGCDVRGGVGGMMEAVLTLGFG